MEINSTQYMAHHNQGIHKDKEFRKGLDTS